MNGKKKESAVFLSSFRRVISGIIIIGLAACILGAATLVVLKDHNASRTHGQAQSKQVAPLSKPEGWARATGRIFGLLAATLLFFQFGLSSKPKPLDRIFGLHRLLHFHRCLGVSLVILASLHPLFMFASRNEEIGPLRLAIWPLLLGVLLLIGLWSGVCTALWRKFLALPYQKWYFMHRFAMFGAMVIFTLHVWNVTDDFHRGWPLYGLVAALLLYAVLLSRITIFKPMSLRKLPFTVIKNELAGKDTHEIELVPGKGKMFSYAPGQFAFVTFFSQGLPVERHHWTISSSPIRSESCVFTIKCSGDFTALVGRVKAGDKAAVDGPYGLFSHLAHGIGPQADMVMIAGGIGITPMLSMLRYMVDMGDHRCVTLVWSNRTEENILCREELEGMKKKHPKLIVHHVLTRQDTYPGPKGRLTLELLQGLLAGHGRDAAVFVCGPPTMINEVCKNLKRMGFRRSHIYQEKFSY